MTRRGNKVRINVPDRTIIDFTLENDAEQTSRYRARGKGGEAEVKESRAEKRRDRDRN